MFRTRTYRGGGAGEKRRLAFTLIELLTVIAIISVLAALVVPLSGVAMSKARISRVRAELNRYVTAIETYKLEVGSYPSDNGKLKTTSTNDVALWRQMLAYNPLYYELGGAIFTNKGSGAFITANRREEISATALQENFNISGIQNSARRLSDVPYKGTTFKPDQSTEASALGSETTADIELLTVPAKGPYMQAGRTEDGRTNAFNPWFYDASTTNRHNRQTFDLWAEITVRGETHVIGNWKE